MSRDNVTGYIQESSNTAQTLLTEKVMKYRIFDHVELFIKDPLPKGFDLTKVLDKIHKNIPENMLAEIDMILIGEFPMLQKNDFDAYYADGAIYLTNKQNNESDMYDDIVHELAHSLESSLSMEIYGDGQLEYEFIAKRRMLFHLLTQHGYNSMSQMDYLNPDYSKSFDNFLYKEVGYDTIRNIAPNLFLSPYGATSLREYFANGFEKLYVTKEKDHIKKVSPKLYEKLEQLYYMGRFDAETEMAYNMEDEKGWSNKHGY